MQKIDGRKWKLKWVEFGVRGGENGVDYKAEHVLCLAACFFCGKEMHLWVRVIFIKKNCYSSFPIFISLFSHYACVWLHFYSSFSN